MTLVTPTKLQVNECLALSGEYTPIKVGETLSGNIIIATEGWHYYFSPDGEFYHAEEAWFSFEKIEAPMWAKYITAEELWKLKEEYFLLLEEALAQEEEEEWLRKEQEWLREEEEKKRKLASCIMRFAEIYTGKTYGNPDVEYQIRDVFPEIEEEAIWPLAWAIFYGQTGHASSEMTEAKKREEKKWNRFGNLPFTTHSWVEDNIIYQKRSYYYYQYGSVGEKIWLMEPNQSHWIPMR